MHHLLESLQLFMKQIEGDKFRLTPQRSWVDPFHHCLQKLPNRLTGFLCKCGGSKNFRRSPKKSFPTLSPGEQTSSDAPG